MNRAVYATATTIGSIGWGALFTFSTRYLAIDLGGGTELVMLLIGSSWGFTLLAILAGKISRLLGERLSILMGLLCSVLLLLASLISNPVALAILLASISFPWFIMWSIVLKVVFSNAARPGLEYSIVTIGSGLGYAIGSMLTGPFYAISGFIGVFILSSVIFATPPLLYYYFYEEDSTIQGLGSTVNTLSVVRKTLFPLISIALIIFARELLYSLAPEMLNMSMELVLPGLPEWAKYTVYGLLYAGGAAISPFIRILSGRLVDKHGAFKVYICAVIAYIMFYWSFTKTTGLLQILIWQIPLYPFLDISFNTYIARYLSRDELITGFGAVHAFTAIGGMLQVLLLLAGEINTDYTGIMITVFGVLSILLVTEYSRRKL